MKIKCLQWNIKITACSLLLCFSFLLAQPSYGLCSEAPAVPTQMDTISVSMSDWTTLKENLIEQEKLLNELSAELENSKTQLQTSNEELEITQSSLTTSQAETLQLRKQLKEQQVQIETLKSQLNELTTYATDASKSIDLANQSLQSMRKEIKAAKEEHLRTERRLNRQRIIWQIIAAGLGIALVTK